MILTSYFVRRYYIKLVCYYFVIGQLAEREREGRIQEHTLVVRLCNERSSKKSTKSTRHGTVTLANSRDNTYD